MSNVKISKIVLTEDEADLLAGAMKAACDGKVLTETERKIMARVHRDFKTNDVYLAVSDALSE